MMLISGGGLYDPNFRHTVVLVGEHNADGALGVVLNVLEQTEQGFLLLRGEFVEHRDQHCTVAACAMEQGSEVPDHAWSQR